MADLQKKLGATLPADIDRTTVYGQDNSVLQHIGEKLGVRIEPNGNQYTVFGGNAAKRRAARNIINEIAGAVREGKPVTRELVGSMIEKAGKPSKSPSVEEEDSISCDFNEAVFVMNNKKAIGPRNPSQAKYLQALKEAEVVFGLGPAGTGKTFLAVAAAVHAFENDDKIKKIILCRPAVEAGERLGFLPGDMKDKIDPYMRPLYDALYELKGNQKVVTNLIESGQIEIAPLAFMRGRTLSNAFIILDEAQNTTEEQMKMFLTRMGKDSRMVVTGDHTQIDLPNETPSGLLQAVKALEGVEGVKIHEFDVRDVVRYYMVSRMLEGYQALEAREKAANAPKPREP